MILFTILPSFVGIAARDDKEDQLVYVIPVRGTIDPGLAEYMKRSVALAKEKMADVLLVEIDTFGGRVDAATEIRDILLDVDIPVITFVPHRAWSAGTLIAISGDKLIMGPGSSIGAAETRPLEEKYISAFAAEFRATAEATGRDPNIAAAMVDKDMEIQGVVEKGQLLTLSAKEGERLGFTDGIAKDRQSACAFSGFEASAFIEAEMAKAESVARFLTDPTVSSILLTLGFIGIVFEILTPGWGVAGTTGVLFLGLFYGGRLVVGLVGWEILFLFLIGLLLLAFEIFVLPGFGVAGIAGLIAMFTSIGLSFTSPIQALRAIVVALLFTIIAVTVGIKYLPKSKFGGRFILSKRQLKEDGYVASQDMSWVREKSGHAITPLRPAGIVEVDGQRIDAMSRGEYIERGQKIQVIDVEGNKVVVRGIDKEA
jgi:membrane-bound serine protease (ClpP class)